MTRTVQTHWKVTAQSMGSFLDPPGAPTHRFSVYGWTGWTGQDPKRRARSKPNEPDHSISLLTALEEPEVDDTTKRLVQQLLDFSTIRDSEDWQAHVYGYFNHCYSPDGIDRNVTRCIVDRSDGLPAERHLGFLLIKTWFPNAVPRADLIESGGQYGTEKCVHCGERIQYEAKYDGWTVFGQSGLGCPTAPEDTNGNHERPTS